MIRYIASLSHLLSVAWKEWEWIPENPVFKIAKPSLSNARQRYLSREEQTALLEEVKKSKCPVLLPIAVLALSTGMRAGKIKNLTWGDVDFAEGVIRLRTTKNGEPLTIPLMGYARSLLSDHQRRGRHLIKEALVFPAPSNPSKPYDIRSAWEAALRRANICDFHFHDLRHTNATTLRKQGKDLYEIGSLLGHKDSRSTARYTHIQTERKSKMVEDLNRELFRGNNDSFIYEGIYDFAGLLERGWWTTAEVFCIFMGVSPSNAGNESCCNQLRQSKQGQHIFDLVASVEVDGSIGELTLIPWIGYRAPCIAWLKWAMKKPSISINPSLLEAAGIGADNVPRPKESYRDKGREKQKFHF